MIIKKKKNTQKKLMKDLENIYQHALLQSNLTIALKVKELQLKEEDAKTIKSKDRVQLNDLSDDTVIDLIHQLKITI